MAKIKIIAGDFSGSGSYIFGQLSLIPKDSKWGMATAYDIVRDIKEIQLADEKSGVKLFGAVGWGTVGALVAGPVGILIGGLLGGKGKKTVFVAEFNNGKKLMGEIDSDAWNKIIAKRMGM